VSLADYAERVHDLAEKPRHGCLSRTRVAREHDVVAHVKRRKTSFDPHLLDTQRVGKNVDLTLDVTETDKGVKFSQNLLQGPRLRTYDRVLC